MQRAHPAMYEFQVIKSFEGGVGTQRERLLVISSEHLAEVAGEDVIGLHALNDILGLVVSDKNETEVIVEFKDWRPTQYFITERDSFVGSLGDVMGLRKGTQFSIRLEPFFSHTLPDKPAPLYQVPTGGREAGVGRWGPSRSASETYVSLASLHIFISSFFPVGGAQNECEIYMISRFMAAYNVFKDAGTLGSQRAQAVWFPLLMDYACNMHVSRPLPPSPPDPRPPSPHTRMWEMELRGWERLCLGDVILGFTAGGRGGGGCGWG